MQFSCFVCGVEGLNMKNNDNYNFWTKFGVHHILSTFENHGIAQPPPNLTTLKAYLTPGVGGRFRFFFAKRRRKDEL